MTDKIKTKNKNYRTYIMNKPVKHCKAIPINSSIYHLLSAALSTVVPLIGGRNGKLYKPNKGEKMATVEEYADEML